VDGVVVVVMYCFENTKFRTLPILPTPYLYTCQNCFSIFLYLLDNYCPFVAFFMQLFAIRVNFVKCKCFILEWSKSFNFADGASSAKTGNTTTNENNEKWFYVLSPYNCLHSVFPYYWEQICCLIRKKNVHGERNKKVDGICATCSWNFFHMLAVRACSSNNVIIEVLARIIIIFVEGVSSD